MVSVPAISNPDDKSDTAEPLETKTFEFVTITNQPSKVNRDETSRQVRTQAMRDYLRKQTKEAITGVAEVVSAVILEEPSQYKGRFKLNTWTHKTKTKSLNAGKARSKDVGEQAARQGMVLNDWGAANFGNLRSHEWQSTRAGRLPNLVISVNARLDPFDSLAIQLGPHSENLLVHCQLPRVVTL